jgi:hypothetical protein
MVAWLAVSVLVLLVFSVVADGIEWLFTPHSQKPYDGEIGDRNW